MEKTLITLAQIHARLKEILTDIPLSQKELAKEIGVTQQQISKYLCGIAFPSLDTLANLCRVLDVEPNYILCFDLDEK